MSDLEVEGGLLLAHAAREEVDARHGGGDAAQHRAHRVPGHLLGGRRGHIQAGQAHVGLQQHALHQYAVLVQEPEDVAVDALTPVCILLKGVVCGSHEKPHTAGHDL